MGRLRQVASQLVVDAWTALSYKAPLQAEANTAPQFMEQSWLRPEDSRRLHAYAILAAYEANAARTLLTGGSDDPDENREYGDAALIIDQITAALLGDTQEIVVDGADDYDPDLDDATPAADDADGPSAEDLAANATARGLSQAQQFMRDWADDVHLPLRLADGERQTVELGDGVILIGWDADRGRPTWTVMDPGCYFPVIPDKIDTYEYPDRVHFAWELPGEDFADGHPRLRRLTYSREPIHPRIVEGERGELLEVVPDDASLDAEGRIVRTYPWAPDEPSRYACYYTDATWVLDAKTAAEKIDQLDESRAIYAVDADGDPLDDVDLGHDFVPVVHVPNMHAGGNHFGQSSLSRVLQLLDDLQATDTDAQRSSSTTGNPTIVVHGAAAPAGPDPRNVRALDAERRGTITSAEAETLDIGGGGAYFVGQAGGATVLDTSMQLRELREMVQSLRERLQVNSRLPAAMLGTMKPSEAPSGYAIQLSFGPLDSMVRQMRLTRAVKHPLALKMVYRLFQLNDDDIPDGPTPRMGLQLGSYLPSDKAGTLELVVSAVRAKLISLETGIAMLIEVGFPIDDIADEIAKIEARDFEGANALADVGLADEARAYLRRGTAVPAPGGPPAVPPAPVVDPPTPPNLA